MACRIIRNQEGKIEQVIAPNGKPSKLYRSLKDMIPEDYQPDVYVQSMLDKGLIRNLSKEEVALALWNKTYEGKFKDWFASSKITDENGEPLLVYHGTPAFEGDTLKKEKINKGWGDEESGFFFSDDKKYSEKVKSNVKEIIPAFLSIQNPVEENRALDHDQVVDTRMSNPDNDGIIGVDFGQVEGKTYVIFEPNQAKSIYNTGKFSLENDSLYYQSENKNDRDREMTDKLVPLIEKLGISVVSLEHWASVTGQTIPEGITALADLSHKMIAVADGKADKTTLPEEIGHLIVEQYLDTYEGKRALKYVESTPEFDQYYQEYFDRYDAEIKAEKRTGDADTWARKEIAGKLMGTHIIKEVERQGDTGLMRMLTRLWEKFLNLFKSPQRRELESFLEEIYGSVEVINPKDAVYYHTDTAEPKTILEKILDSLKARLKELEARKGDTEKLKKQIREINKEIETQQNGLGLIKFLEYMAEDSDDAAKYMESVRDGSKKISAKNLQQLGEYIAYYEPYLYELEKFVSFMPNGLDEEIKQAILEKVDTELGKFRRIKQFRDVLLQEQYVDTIRNNSAAELGLDINDPDIDAKIEAAYGGYNFKKAAEEVHSDSASTLFWFGSLRDANDTLLRLVHVIVDRVKRKVFRQSLDFGKKVVKKLEELGFMGKDIGFVYETEDGKRTGYYIDDVRYRAFDKARKDFADELHKKYGLSEVYEERQAQKAVLPKKTLDKYNRDWAKWFNANTITIDNVQEYIAEKKAQLTKKEFRHWEIENIGTTLSGDTYYKGELSRPSDGRTKNTLYGSVKTNDWTNYEYNKLSKQQKDLAAFFREEKSKADQMVPGTVKPGFAPQIHESAMDILFDQKGGIFDKLGRAWESAKQTVVKQTDDTLFGIRGHERPDGSWARFVPVHFVAPVQDTDMLTSDAASALIAYHDMAVNFTEMSKAVPELEVLKEQVGARKLVTKKGTQSGKTTKTYEVLQKFLDMQVYGMHKEELEVTVAGKTFNVGKMITSFNNYVRKTNLGLNFFTTLSNYIQSSVYTKIEDFIGQYTTHTSKLKAEKVFWENIYDAISQLGKPIKTNKMLLAMERFQIMGSFDGLFDDLNKKRLTRKAIDSGLYFSYELVDFRIKSKLMVALLDNLRLVEGRWLTSAQFKNQKLKGDFKDFPSAWDTLQVENNTITGLPQDEIDRLAGRVEYLANMIDGRLSRVDYAAAHQHAVFQLITTHRNWLFSGIQRRFKSSGINMMTGEMEEGYFRTTGNWMFKTFLSKERIRSIREMSARWDQLSEHERTALLRTFAEVVFSVAVLAAAKILNGLADDEDDYILDVMAYLANRGLLETAAFMNPTELIHAIEAPIVGVRNLELSMDIGEMLSNQVIERGQWEGYTKGQRYFLKHIPGVKGLSLWRDPSAANQFLKNKPLKLFY